MNIFENSGFGNNSEGESSVDIDPKLFADSMDPEKTAYEIMQEAQLANPTPEQEAELETWRLKMEGEAVEKPPTLN